MKTILAVSVLSLGILASHGSMACSLNDYSCNPFDLGPMPDIRMEPQLRLEQPAPQAIITPRRETQLEWCFAYYKNLRGSRTVKNDQFCSRVVRGR